MPEHAVGDSHAGRLGVLAAVGSLQQARKDRIADAAAREAEDGGSRKPTQDLQESTQSSGVSSNSTATGVSCDILVRSSW
jgi:hypothetical protein